MDENLLFLRLISQLINDFTLTPKQHAHPHSLSHKSQVSISVPPTGETTAPPHPQSWLRAPSMAPCPRPHCAPLFSLAPVGARSPSQLPCPGPTVYTALLSGRVGTTPPPDVAWKAGQACRDPINGPSPSSIKKEPSKSYLRHKEQKDKHSRRRDWLPLYCRVKSHVKAAQCSWLETSEGVVQGTWAWVTETSSSSLATSQTLICRLPERARSIKYSTKTQKVLKKKRKTIHADIRSLFRSHKTSMPIIE